MHSRPPEETARAYPNRVNTVPIDQTLNVLSFNVEGVKGNAATLMKLAQNNSILCLQETWLWTFEESTLENIIPNYEGFVRCSDMNENISFSNYPR